MIHIKQLRFIATGGGAMKVLMKIHSPSLVTTASWSVTEFLNARLADLSLEFTVGDLRKLSPGTYCFLPLRGSTLCWDAGDPRDATDESGDLEEE